jgi:hypothetical protein
LVIKPRITTLSKALTPDFPKAHIKTSAQTAKESESPESYTILSANNEKLENGKNKAAKLGRWTQEEKQKFIDGKSKFFSSILKKGINSNKSLFQNWSKIITESSTNLKNDQN